MGGRIWAESKEGLGSTFHFTIFAPAAEGKLTDSKLKGKRLLALIEDEGCKKNLTRHALSWGIRISIISSSDQAREIMEREGFDALLLDMQIPGAQTLASEMGESEIGEAMPLITLMPSNYRSSSNASLAKPVKLSQLHSILLKVLAEKPFIKAERPLLSMPNQDVRILLAEDNLVNQKVALLMLKRLGYIADVAANGLEVLEALKRQHYDIILMDVQMPEMDGLETARRICEMKLESPPKILAMTAYALEGDREKCLDSGMDGYVSKPVQIEELRLALEGLDKENFEN
jgi:CheY-like chemotaxis protein